MPLTKKFLFTAPTDLAFLKQKKRSFHKIVLKKTKTKTESIFKDYMYQDFQQKKTRKNMPLTQISFYRAPTDLAFLKQKKESFTKVLKKLQKQKDQSKGDEAFTRKINEQITTLQAELDILEQEIELAKLDDDSNGAVVATYTAEALYESVPNEESELHLRAGDVITNVVISRTEWWEGEILGKRGYFPRTYVRLKPLQISRSDIIMGSIKDAVKWASDKLENKPQPFKVVALFAFEAASDNELAFDEGDIITVHDMSNDPWWAGELNGRLGFFPKEYVELERDKSEKEKEPVKAATKPTETPKEESTPSTPKRKNFDFRMSIHILDRMKDFVNRQEKQNEAASPKAEADKDKKPKPEEKEKEKEKEKDLDSLKEEMERLRGMLQNFEKMQVETQTMQVETQTLQDEIALWKKKYNEQVEQNKALKDRLSKYEKW